MGDPLGIRPKWPIYTLFGVGAIILIASFSFVRAVAAPKPYLRTMIVAVKSGPPQAVKFPLETISYTVLDISTNKVCWNHQEPVDCAGPDGEYWFPAATGSVQSKQVRLTDFFAADVNVGAAVCSKDASVWRPCRGFHADNTRFLSIENANQVRSTTGDDTGARRYLIEYTVPGRPFHKDTFVQADPSLLNAPF